MVAYKKLSNHERENISRIMVQNIINKEIQNTQDEISSRLTKLLYDKIPDDVKEFISKYPDYINKIRILLFKLKYLIWNIPHK